MNETPFTDPLGQSSTPLETPQTQLPPQAPVTPVPPVKKGIFRSKKFWLIFVLVIVLVGGAVAAYLLTRKDSTPVAQAPAESQQVNESTELTIAPRFTLINDYLKDGDTEWFAAEGGVFKIKGSEYTVYSHGNGLPGGTPTAIVKYKNTIWVSTSDGVATLDEKSGVLTSSKSDIQNGRLFYDKYGDRLFLSEFTGFFELINNKWQKIEGPVDAFSHSQFAAGKDNIATTANKSGSPVWVMDRASNTWKQVQPTTIDDQVSSVFVLNDQIFVRGRGVGYTSCDSAGKASATAVERLDSNEKWQPLTDFNADKSRPELGQVNVFSSDEVMFETSVCGANEKTTSYTVSYDGTTLKLNNPKQIDRNSGLMGVNEAEQTALTTKITNVTKLPPYLEVLNVTKDGSILVAYTEDLNASSILRPNKLALLKDGKLSDKQEIKLPKTDYVPQLVPVLCGDNQTLEYVFLGLETETEGGGDGTWRESKLYSYKNGALGDSVDLAGDLSAAGFSCTDATVTWVGKSQVKQLARKSGAITAVGPALGSALTQYNVSVSPVSSGALWVLVVNQNKSDSGVLNLVNAGGQSTKVGTVAGTTLRSSTDKVVWVTGGGIGTTEPTSTFMVDATNKTYGKISGVGLAWATFFTDGRTYVVQPKASQNSSIWRPLELHAVESEGTVKSIDKKSLPLGYSYNAVGNGVVDASRSKIWLTDAQYGTFALQVPKN